MFNKAKLRAATKRAREDAEWYRPHNLIRDTSRAVAELKDDFQRSQTVGIPRIEPEMKFNDNCELYNKNTEEVPIKVAIQMIIDYLGLAYVDEKVDRTAATLVKKSAMKKKGGGDGS